MSKAIAHRRTTARQRATAHRRATACKRAARHAEEPSHVKEPLHIEAPLPLNVEEPPTAHRRATARRRTTAHRRATGCRRTKRATYPTKRMEWRQQDPKDSLGQNTRTPKQHAANPKPDAHSGSTRTQATPCVKEAPCRRWIGAEKTHWDFLRQASHCAAWASFGPWYVRNSKKKTFGQQLDQEEEENMGRC